jgi:hypothetical protein
MLWKRRMQTPNQFKSIPPAFKALIALTALFISDAIFAINKCEQGGKITYTDQPCANDATTLPYTEHVSPPDDPAAARQRYLADKKQLEQINKLKAREEKQTSRDALVYARQQKSAQDQELICKNLDLKRQIANQNQIEAKTRGKRTQIKKSQLQMQQAENNYTRTCN